MPTILQAVGIPEPLMVNGVTQKPLEWVSMNYTFGNPDAPDRHQTQYFEMYTNHGIYHKGWTACTRRRIPWITSGGEIKPFDDDEQELYAPDDWSQIRMEFSFDGGGIIKGGEITLFVDGQIAGEGRVDRTMPFIFSADDGMDVGTDTGLRVAEDEPTRQAVVLAPRRDAPAEDSVFIAVEVDVVAQPVLGRRRGQSLPDRRDRHL